MGTLRQWTADLVLATVVAAVITLIWHVLGIDKSWADAAQTYGSSFLVMMAVGLWQRLKKDKEKN